jgi:hypothetical protein
MNNVLGRGWEVWPRSDGGSENSECAIQHTFISMNIKWKPIESYIEGDGQINDITKTIIIVNQGD